MSVSLLWSSYYHHYDFREPVMLSVVGIATGYGLDGPVIESRWGGEIFHTRPDLP